MEEEVAPPPFPFCPVNQAWGQVKAKPQQAAWEESGWSLALCGSLPALSSKVLPEHLGQQQGTHIYTNLLVCLNSKIGIEMKA